jgi:phosphopantetheinyl transferase
MRAAEGIVHVWRADLARVEDGLEDLLCADELARAACILSRRRRILWTRSRGMLRALLARYTDRDPRALHFVFGPHGKPALLTEGGAPARDLRFSLSHSAGLALVAVSSEREVGVDIEHADGRRTEEFLHAWVMREAVGKCRGTGLVKTEDSPAEDLWTAEVDAGRATVAALAVEGGRCELRHFEWSTDYRPTAPVSACWAGFAMKAPPR